MHLLLTPYGSIADSTSTAEIVDLGQTPGEVVVLSAADSELACLAAAHRHVGIFTLRLANLLRLGHPLSVDLYGERVIRASRLVVVRLLGGHSYWPYGVEQITAICRDYDIPVAFLPGNDQPDADLFGFSTLSEIEVRRLWYYLLHGGSANAEQFLCYVATLIGYETMWQEPVLLPPAGLLTEFSVPCSLTNAPTAVVVFYRSLTQAGDMEAIETLTTALAAEGLTPLPLFVTSLKDPLATPIIRRILAHSPPDVILNATSFSFSSGCKESSNLDGVSKPSLPDGTSSLSSDEVIYSPFEGSDCPILQVVMASSSIDTWREGTHGLLARDLVMNVVMPELDGRIITRAISFKNSTVYNLDTECDVVVCQPAQDRITFTAKLAAKWVRLRRTQAAERRIVLVLANYPNRNGRIGNGVGLDTPAAIINVLDVLTKAGYRVEAPPATSAALLDQLLAGPTNSTTKCDMPHETLSLDDYHDFLLRQPDVVHQRVFERWGAAVLDPFMHCGKCFALPVVRFGNVAVAIQPARGYNIDPVSSYHDPALVPPHGYLAFYAWVREVFDAHAIVHMGKHGNLEWLPGKSLALSDTCFPEVALGPMPCLYPFIVNNPGEGTQAKRRTAAVIIDHMTPPMTRAESYGPLCELEQLLDEYYEASGVDPRRREVLKKDILSLMCVTGLDRDLDITSLDGSDATLVKLDNYLCMLKELQIRDGLHVFGRAPDGDQRRDLLIAIARTPRGSAPHEVSLLRALAEDLALAFDPLNVHYAQLWNGPWPVVLYNNASPWRTAGDTVERLEGLARSIIDRTITIDKTWNRTALVVQWIINTLAPTVDACGIAEMTGLLRGLDGRFVMPGPSGAPTRGRSDVLPTGRNFYSVDTRTVPTPAAWRLGWASATLLLERHLQEYGNWPQAIALTAWGTTNMRTGGDDIAQGLALMGVQPTWEPASRRVIGFEIMPSSVLDRPRVDVTLRVSGFFRDAFPSLINLFDSAVQAVAQLDEPTDINPLAARIRTEARHLITAGLAPDVAQRQASYRVFGSRPGAYGAGLQVLIDEKCWETDADLARAYIVWGGYAYGTGTTDGTAQPNLFADRLRNVDTVVQNQDNREHDLLDSDDYYQFEGGITAAVRVLSGQTPAVYHTDHSQTEFPKIFTLSEEIARVVRGRAANPKWIRGVMRHGYKGAFEIAATVDYLFAFAATTHCVENHHFDLLFDAYLGDEAVRSFITEVNPYALREITDRFEEALTRDLWRPRRNTVQAVLTETKQLCKNALLTLPSIIR